MVQWRRSTAIHSLAPLENCKVSTTLCALRIMTSGILVDIIASQAIADYQWKPDSKAMSYMHVSNILTHLVVFSQAVCCERELRAEELASSPSGYFSYAPTSM